MPAVAGWKNGSSSTAIRAIPEWTQSIGSNAFRLPRRATTSSACWRTSKSTACASAARAGRNRSKRRPISLLLEGYPMALASDDPRCGYPSALAPGMQAMQDLSVLADEDGRRIMGACPPERTTLLKLIQAFVSYAHSHTDELPNNAALAVTRALQEAFPCGANGTGFRRPSTRRSRECPSCDASVDTRTILDHIGTEELGRCFGEAEATIIGPCRP